MQFNSFLYLFGFLPLLIFTFLFFKKRNLNNLIFLCFSLYFYLYNDWQLIFILGISVIVDYFIAISLEKTSNETSRKLKLFASIFVNLSLLSFFKYYEFYSDLFNRIVNSERLLGEYRLNYYLPYILFSLPPGISFYTFQSMSYTFDVYRKKIKAEYNFIKLFAYVAFFPQLIAGPIERFGNLAPQLSKTIKFKKENLESGIFLIFYGLCKKIVFADNLMSITENSMSKSFPGAGIIMALAFGFGIYCDFSAYTDIARGSARLFNIKLSRNFLTPYFSSNPQEFWKRWHITLSQWLRDYLYIPLGGSRFSKFSTMRNVFITMFLGGLWHGAGILFIVWGIYHAILIIFYSLFPIDQFLSRLKFGNFLSIFILNILIFIGWIFFRCDINNFSFVINTIFNFFSSPIEFVFFHYLYVVLLFICPIIFMDYFGYKKDCEFSDFYNKFNLKTKSFFYIIMLYLIIIFGSRDSYEFIYFQF